MIIKRFSETDKNKKTSPWIKLISWIIPTLGLGVLFKKYLGLNTGENIFISSLITSCAYFLLDDIATKKRLKAEDLARKLDYEEKQRIVTNVESTLKNNLPMEEMDKIFKASKFCPNWGDGDEYLGIHLYRAEDIANSITEHPEEKHYIFYLCVQDPESCFSYDGKYWYYSDYQKAPFQKLSWSSVVKKIKSLFDNDLEELKRAQVDQEDYDEVVKTYDNIIKTLK